MHEQGLLIAIEGIDGAGTSTQMAGMAAHIARRGREAITTAEPSKGPLGLLLRRGLRGEIPMDEASLALLFAADRLHHVREVVAPALARGVLALSDRYVMSSYAYQASALDLAWIQEINRQARPPDVSIFFRVGAKTAAARRLARGGTPEHFDALARQERVAAAYERALALPGVGEVRVIDAEPGPEEVARQVHSILDEVLDRVDKQVIHA